MLTVDAGAAGTLEAADLVHSRVADGVAVFDDPPNATDEEFIRRGLAYEDRAAQTRRLLGTLGVTRVQEINRANGTEAEGAVLPQWCDAHDLHTVVVVTSAEHSRRVQRVLRRANNGRPIAFLIRPARFSAFDPEHWWQSREGLRTGIIELEKLLLDVLRHPMS